MTQPVSSNKRAKRVDTIKVFDFVNSIFGETMHLKRVGSIADAAIGLLTAEELILLDDQVFKFAKSAAF